VVSAAEILSIAAFGEGKDAQAFPSFGSERMGAPVTAFCRIDTRPIRLREPIMTPDALIIQDPTLLPQRGLFDGLAEDGYILVNSSRSFAELGVGEMLAKHPRERQITVPATELALEHVGRPLPNAALLGAFAALTGEVKLESVLKAIREKFPGKVGEKNATAAKLAYEFVTKAAEAACAPAN